MSRTNNVFKPTSGCIVRHYKADSVFCGTNGCQTEGYDSFRQTSKKIWKSTSTPITSSVTSKYVSGHVSLRLLSIPKSNRMCHKGRLGLYGSKHRENRFERKTDDNSIGGSVFHYRVLKNHYNSYNITV